MPWIPIAMAAASLAQQQLEQKPKEERQRKLAATTEALSPWTKMHGTLPQESSAMGAALGGASSGLGLQQSMQNSQSQNRLNSAYANYLNSGSNNPWLSLKAGDQ